MRILNVTPAYEPFREKGSLAIKVRAIAEHTARAGASVTVLTTTYDNARAAGSAGICGIEVVYLPMLAHYRAVTLNPEIFRFCSRRLGEFDFVHIYGLYDLLGPVVAEAARARHVPYVVEPMGMFRPLFRNLLLKHLYHRLLGRRLLRGASCVIATSAQEREEFIQGELPADKIELRRNGIDLPASFPPPATFRKKFHLPANLKLILFLGRLVPKKSPDMLLEAFARWQAGDAPPAALILAGPHEAGGYLEHLRHLASHLGVQDRVRFTGPLFENDKWAAYRDADLFVLPSQNENFGNTAAESVAAGTPVIVTDQCGIAPWIVPRAGLAIPHRLDALQAAITRVFADDTLYARLRDGCRDVAQSLSWDEPMAQQLEIYRRHSREETAKGFVDVNGSVPV
ncbi:MAG: glycosyltransferase [Candidatus Acidiferrales bacterium]